MGSYLTAPRDAAGMPRGIPYIVANEAAERFSYYGMRAILVVFMTQYLRDRSGQLSTMGEDEAKAYFHSFSTAVYAFPIMGALLSDAFLGKYRTILLLSLVYCAGHLTLALDETEMGLLLGLGLIAVGSGGIKPCVSAHVGDQFGPKNRHLIDKVFSWFYFSINLGAFASQLATPLLLEHYGPSWAFGVPGILMALATLFFFLGRNTFVHIPAAGPKALAGEVVGKEGLSALVRLAVIYAFVAMFWALFDQTASAWVLQAEKMDRVVFGTELLSSQIQAANPALVMVLIPLCSFVLYPAIDRVFPLTALRKIGIGFFITVLAFLVPAFIELKIAAGEHPSILWQVLAYVVMTLAEVFVSITCLEFSYTQAPNRMKSVVMALFLLSVSLGNLFTAGVNVFIQNPDGSSKLAGASYYLFFAAAMFVTALAFVGVARRFQVRTYIQGE